jgi:hypothetical protein
MNQPKLNDTQWIDIVPPPPPEDNSLLIWSLIVGLAILSSIIVLYLWQRQPKHKTRRQIDKLGKQIIRNHKSNKYILKQLEATLCQRYHVPYLSKINITDKQWSDFLQQLTTACYQPVQPDIDTTLSLLRQAKYFNKLA